MLQTQPSKSQPNLGNPHSEIRNQNRRRFIKRLTWLGAGALGAGSLGWASQVEPERIEITRRTLALPRLSPAFDGFTITQVSDIHLSSWMTQQRLEHIVHLINGLDSDVVAITGDFVSRHQGSHKAVLVETLSQLRPRLGAFAIMGNRSLVRSAFHSGRRPTERRR